MSTKHTPGPWQADGREVRAVVAISHKRPLIMTTCHFVDIGNAEANARLISAAPDLLDAAMLAVDYLGDDFNPKRIPALDALLLAIRKAIGGTE